MPYPSPLLLPGPDTWLEGGVRAGRVSLLTELGLSYRDWLPSAFRDSPDHLAVLHTTAREVERLEDALASVRAQFSPQSADILLSAWEVELGLPFSPGGETVDQRRNAVLNALAAAVSPPSGIAWTKRITRLLGPTWSYEEHIPGDPRSPPEATIILHIPYGPSSPQHQQLRDLLDKIMPAHLDVILAFNAGFLLDEGHLDEDVLI